MNEFLRAVKVEQPEYVTVQINSSFVDCENFAKTFFTDDDEVDFLYFMSGTIQGDVKTVKKIYFLTNTDASAEHFSMEPAEQFAAVKDIRANGWQLLGNFHSHPKSPARLSAEDKRLIFNTKLSYLILSLEAEPTLKSFTFDRDKNSFEEEIFYDD